MKNVTQGVLNILAPYIKYAMYRLYYRKISFDIAFRMIVALICKYFTVDNWDTAWTIPKLEHINVTRGCIFPKYMSTYDRVHSPWIHIYAGPIGCMDFISTFEQNKPYKESVIRKVLTPADVNSPLFLLCQQKLMALKCFDTVNILFSKRDS